MTQLTHPVSNASIIVFRIVFGGLLAWETWKYFPKGWIDYFYITPIFLFPFEGFEWVQPWSALGMYAHFFVTGLAGVGIALGLFYRLSVFIYFVGFTYIFLLDKSHYLNHHYLLLCLVFLMLFIPAHRAFSIDALLRSRIRSKYIAQGALWAFRLQLGIVYFYAALVKANPDWISGRALGPYVAAWPRLGWIESWYSQPWFLKSVSSGALVFDFLVIPLLLWKKTRGLAIAFGTLFHLLNAYHYNLGVFPWMGIATLTLFCRPDWPQRLWAKVKRTTYVATPTPKPSALQPTMITLATIYFVFHALFPLRGYLLIDNPYWWGWGERFSWRLVPGSLASHIEFRLRSPGESKLRVVELNGFLTEKQIGALRGHPDMMYQFAQYLSHRFAKQGTPAEVYVSGQIRLNGGPQREWIDGSVNLAAQPFDWGPPQWVLPFT